MLHSRGNLWYIPYNYFTSDLIYKKENATNSYFEGILTNKKSEKVHLRINVNHNSKSVVVSDETANKIVDFINKRRVFNKPEIALFYMEYSKTLSKGATGNRAAAGAKMPRMPNNKNDSLNANNFNNDNNKNNGTDAGKNNNKLPAANGIVDKNNIVNNKSNPLNRTGINNPNKFNISAKIDPLNPAKNTPLKRSKVDPLNPTGINPSKKIDPVNRGKVDPLNPGKVDPLNPGKIDPFNSAKVNPLNLNKIDPLNPTNTLNPAKVYPLNPANITPSGIVNPKSKNNISPTNYSIKPIRPIVNNRTNPLGINPNSLPPKNIDEYHPLNPNNPINNGKPNALIDNPFKNKQDLSNPVDPKQNPLNPVQPIDKNNKNNKSNTKNLIDPMNPSNSNVFGGNSIKKENENNASVLKVENDGNIKAIPNSADKNQFDDKNAVKVPIGGFIHYNEQRKDTGEYVTRIVIKPNTSNDHDDKNNGNNNNFAIGNNSKGNGNLNENGSKNEYGKGNNGNGNGNNNGNSNGNNNGDGNGNGNNNGNGNGINNGNGIDYGNGKGKNNENGNEKDFENIDAKTDISGDIESPGGIEKKIIDLKADFMNELGNAVNNNPQFLADKVKN